MFPSLALAATLVLHGGQQVETLGQQWPIVKYVNDEDDPVLAALRFERRKSDFAEVVPSGNSSRDETVFRHGNQRLHPVHCLVQIDNAVPEVGVVGDATAEAELTVVEPAANSLAGQVHHGAKPIRFISIDIRPPQGANYPERANKVGEQFRLAGTQWHSFGYSRPWVSIGYAWTAPALASKPLYFEDANLERYGHHHGLVQPALSAAHFFTRIPALPYLFGAYPSHRCYYALGYYRPGDCNPHYWSRPKLSVQGALYAGAVATGLVLIIP
jgi:hypothetical protein